MNNLLRPPIPPGTDAKNDAKKAVSESIVSINATLPNEKVVFLSIKSLKRYLLILLLAKSGCQEYSKGTQCKEQGSGCPAGSYNIQDAARDLPLPGDNDDSTQNEDCEKGQGKRNNKVSPGCFCESP